MTFEEWKNNNKLVLIENSGIMSTWELMQIAYNAAVLSEREACAKVCEGLCGIDGSWTAKEFADEIRKRNTPLTETP
jgi:hypothetical protein